MFLSDGDQRLSRFLEKKIGFDLKDSQTARESSRDGLFLNPGFAELKR